jgi:hypothetical protein
MNLCRTILAWELVIACLHPCVRYRPYQPFRWPFAACAALYTLSPCFKLTYP